ncbi:MAG TPA: hypothetical protein PL115_00875 [Bacteroidales bacterium]|jgi:hypothetical protein|nr:hypothetical protein [Bacteroidales bacterium]HPY21556.1 hypothetical protein [Bacteroidales bacterium]HQA93516.1 hypothetical protein [Bacteroidales bacterium]HQN24544.1 hypothetical protein [Bacteroidales bacterium]HQP78397.1 hypothetical protein [Bacteroidales bacterium]
MNQEINIYLATGVYVAPDLEVIEIELTQNILTASLPDVGDGGDAW